MLIATLIVCLDIFYFAENWKYCSKIIFKCVNSAVKTIFNESFGKKKGLWIREQCTSSTEKDRNALLKKKKDQNVDAQVIICIQTDT